MLKMAKNEGRYLVIYKDYQMAEMLKMAENDGR
jgi:hypothetical protein